MYKYFHATLLSVCLFFFSACTAYFTPKTQFNTYLPLSFDNFFEEEVLPLERSVTHEDNLWNTDEIDVSYVDPNRKLMAFTFDDSPAKTLENILAVFVEYNENNPDCMATATLFVNGGLITEDSTATLRAATALGFELGNHTQSHVDLTTLPIEMLNAEIDATDRALSRIDGKERHLLRAPFGRINPLVKAQAPAPILNWSIDTLDWTGISPKKIYESIFDNLFSGAIVLMHDGYPFTVQALKQLLPDLKAAGYQIVNISALAKAHGCKLYNGGEYIRLRKQ
jgi:peptidoglycan/xylan/chitin deacetylase (PgdA/CDA1 family)